MYPDFFQQYLDEEADPNPIRFDVMWSMSLGEAAEFRTRKRLEEAKATEEMLNTLKRQHNFENAGENPAKRRRIDDDQNTPSKSASSRFTPIAPPTPEEEAKPKEVPVVEENTLRNSDSESDRESNQHQSPLQGNTDADDESDEEDEPLPRYRGGKWGRDRHISPVPAPSESDDDEIEYGSEPIEQQAPNQDAPNVGNGEESEEVIQHQVPNQVAIHDDDKAESENGEVVQHQAPAAEEDEPWPRSRGGKYGLDRHISPVPPSEIEEAEEESEYESESDDEEEIEVDLDEPDDRFMAHQIQHWINTDRTAWQARRFDDDTSDDDTSDDDTSDDDTSDDDTSDDDY